MLPIVVMGVTILASWFLPMRYPNGPVEIARLVVAAASILAAGHVPSQPSGVPARRTP